ncbi:hypothetical protein HLK59_29050 [Streptomyces sp. S3(2020)]|uniref:hypothetical protein n=1 Tax=Streptomyces sp. S3(2020) TaxID=2732044 RepID=UPI001489D473|nr:hypothetical protein [Streptomyces sp. S3(2020)]NNN34341.1 hypothetical protein [Streptomyces sp. S3(2020)]
MEWTVHAWRRVRSGTGRSASFLGRLLDEYPAKVTPAGKAGQALFICAVPLGIMFFVWAACSYYGVATAPHCSPGTLLHLAIPAARDDLTACRILPLAADLPSVALGFTSSLAVSIYLTLIARLSRLKGDIVESGLVNASDFTAGALADRLSGLESGIRLGRSAKAGLAALSVGGSAGLYLWAYRGGRSFTDLATVSASRPSAESIRTSWWANYHERPLLAAVWIVIGSLGLYFAAKQGYIYQRLLSFSWAARKAWNFQYVCRARDDDFGWKPVGRIITMVYLGFLNFTISLTAAAYLLRGESGDWKNPVVAVVALLGIWANAGILVALLTVMIRNHRAVVARERLAVAAEIGRLQREEAGVGALERDAGIARFTAQGVLLFEAPRWYPLRGKLKPVLSLAPVLLALYKFGVEFTKLN